jgi:hypothetical protein
VKGIGMSDPATETMWLSGAVGEAVPVTTTARLATLSHMVAAAAGDDDGDGEHVSTVSHRYLTVLTEHLASWGRGACDGDDGVEWAVQQLLLLRTVSALIVSTIAGQPDRQAARELVELSAEYDDMVQREARRRAASETKRTESTWRTTAWSTAMTSKS